VSTAEDANRPRESGGGDRRPRDGRLARSALRGTAWTGASELSGKLLFFISTLILARLLDQADFGVAAYAITVITLFSAIPSLGLGPALIYHEDHQEVLSTGFWLGMASALVFFALLYALAPASALIFDDPRAVDVTRVLALVFPIEALRNVHATLLRKRLAFHRRFVPELLQSISKGGVAIVLALAGFGYWSLIWGSIAAALVSVPAYWIAVGWKPSLRFDPAIAGTLLPFGGRIVGVGLLGAFVRNFDYVVVGRILGAATLGVYVLAFRIPDLLIRNFSTMLGQVLLPVYARVRRDPEAVREAFLAATSYVFALTAPVAFGLALVAEPLVVTAFSAKWIDVVPVIPPICLYALCASISFNMGDLYKALGRPDVLVRLSFARAVVIAPAIWIAATAFGTATAVAWTQAGVAALAMVGNFVIAGLVFEMPVRAALLRLSPILVASATMAVAVWGLDSLFVTSRPVARLAIGVAVGAFVYLITLRLMAREFFGMGIEALRDAMVRRSRAPAEVVG
jgi:O-antigen/teichoic acid export membrane protein